MVDAVHGVEPKSRHTVCFVAPLQRIIAKTLQYWSLFTIATSPKTAMHIHCGGYLITLNKNNL